MNQCNGWDRYPHKVPEPLFKVITLSCNSCGGFECGDFSQVLYLCSECKSRYQVDKFKIFNKKLIHLGKELAEDNCFTEKEE